jgi:transcriptional regulator with XRE-family HTH domain
MGRDMSIGQRVAWYRVRRGLTQEVLAGMVDRTSDWLGKVENGRANLERLSVIKALADALDVTVGDVLGEPTISHWEPGATGRTVTLLREALMNYSALVPALSGTSPAPLPELRDGVGAVWDAYQASRFGYVTARLPRLIAGARLATKEATTDAERRAALRILALSYHAAAATLSKVGEADLAWIASDRGLSAAEECEEAAVVASLARSVAHSLLANGHYASAVEVATRSTDHLAAATAEPSPAYWSLTGSLFLVGAMAAARSDAPAEARQLLARARQASRQLGHDANHAWTAFGPTNVAVHDVSIAVELGDVQTAAALAPRVDARALPVERRVRHALEVARIYTMTNQPAEALALVLHAEREAPEQVKYHYIARELTLTWLRRSKRPNVALDDLARRLLVA